MFTGIISDKAVIRSVEKPGDTRFVIATNYKTASIDIGASIACSGVCLTVVELGPNWFAVDASEETLSLTTARNWQPGTEINTERALCMGDELGGHIVSGHVDGLAKLVDMREENASHRLTIEATNALAGFVAEKGSVALDGISLTVNEVEGNRFGINIIPHTWEMTTLKNLRIGDQLNMEVDMMARYVARLLDHQGIGK